MKYKDHSLILDALTALIATLIFVGGSLADGQVLYSFQGKDGSNPSGNLVADQAGNLYGTTEYGGENGYYGTVFQLAPPPAQTARGHSRHSMFSTTRATERGLPTA